VPPAATTAACEAQQGRAVREEPPVAEQPAAAPTPTAPPLKNKLCAELELLLARVQAAGPEIDLAVAMVHVSQAQVAVAAALGAASAELVDQTADDELTVADGDDAPPADAPLPLGSDEFPDEVLAVVCRFLGLRGLGRLACVARRFTEPTLTEPGGAKLLSPIEEGARLRLAAAAAGSEDVHSYMTHARVGLKAWIRYFEQHLPANVRSVRLVRTTTAADLRRMATKENMQMRKHAAALAWGLAALL
jgi:hypothetical protein